MCYDSQACIKVYTPNGELKQQLQDKLRHRVSCSVDAYSPFYSVFLFFLFLSSMRVCRLFHPSSCAFDAKNRRLWIADMRTSSVWIYHLRWRSHRTTNNNMSASPSSSSSSATYSSS